jgi:zinc/manganese transport system substrate-binding protein
MIMKRILFTLSLFAIALAAEAKLNVVATTPDFGAIAREIGGDRVDVFIMAKPTEDPHFVDAKPSFVVKLNKADALIEGGVELEIGWLPPLIEQARNPKLGNGKPGRILCHQGIALLEIPTTLDRSKGDVHAAGNPHFMTDPANGKIVAETIANALGVLDPKSAPVFKSNLDAFKQKLDAKFEEWKKVMAPYAGRRIVSFHNSWPYFEKRFDIKGELFLEPKPGIPPSPAHLASVIATMKAENIRIIIAEPYLNHRSAELVAGRTDAMVLDFASYPGGKGAPDDYVGWMDSLVQTLAKALVIKAK